MLRDALLTNHLLTMPAHSSLHGYDDQSATKVYVDAKWTIPQTFNSKNGIEIIVMNNAKNEASGTMTFIRNSMLTIMEKGEVNAEDISFTSGRLLH